MNESLQKKRNARLAAVQLLYQRALTGDKRNAGKLVESYLAQQTEAPEARLEPAPHGGLLKEIVEGVLAKETQLETLLESLLAKDWAKARTSPLLLAVLRAALFEMTEKPGLSSAIVISEYVDIAAGFFDEPELGFVNAALDHAALTVRSGASSHG